MPEPTQIVPKPKPTKKVTKKRAPPNALVTLAKALKISRRTVSYLRQYHDAPKSHDVDEWKDFLQKRAIETNDIAGVKHLPEEMQKLRARLLQAQTGKEEAIRKLRELELKTKAENHVPMGEARAAIRAVCAPLRGLRDTLPKGVALQSNPTDPELAEESIRAGLDKVFGMLDKELGK